VASAQYIASPYAYSGLYRSGAVYGSYGYPYAYSGYAASPLTYSAGYNYLYK